MFHFSTSSLAALSKCHPHLQAIAQAAIRKVDFKVLDSTRGRDAQERAFNGGFAKVHFGNSAHNYVPAIAFDLFPAPYDWKNEQSFIDLSKVILPLPEQLGLQGVDGQPLILRWGGDWDMNGDIRDGWDMPHFELHPWRKWSKKSKLFED
ncbi:hypothetical protein [Rhizobium sp. 18055]|uniref:hypothetical protein n=1 Tax=Rhizobium sp. 18055 TaxID=2681403 RepID=UPI0013569778|nr:hypothetical protein [Rhizobium sp. 18055]